MKKMNIGSVVALYPTPVTVVGTMVNGKPNWMLVAHIGIVAHDRIMISCAKAHYTNQGIRETKKVSVSLVDEAFLKKADKVGCVSGNKEDKSNFLPYEMGEAGMPIPNDAPLAMECTVEDVYENKLFENFILKVENTYAADSVLNEQGKVSLDNFKPALFSMNTYEYFATGEKLGKCMHMND